MCWTIRLKLGLVKLPAIFLNLSLGNYIPRNLVREKAGKRRREKEETSDDGEREKRENKGRERGGGKREEREMHLPNRL